MQIDFHHGVTYLLARLAGFQPGEAGIIGYAAQYVDDATNEGVVKFTNGAMYSRISSAHKIIDLHNAFDVINHKVWVPFHFLPGNGGLEAGSHPDGGFINKLVCFPDSFVAEEMQASCIADRDKPYALHRLGITMHVLADTFSHQKFAGVIHQVNEINTIDYNGEQESHHTFKDFFNRVKISMIDTALPLGHGAALSCPDLPYLKWRYANELNPSDVIERDNPQIFNDAVIRMFESLWRYKNAEAGNIIPGQISGKDLLQINENIKNFTSEDGETRHQQWIDSIARGEFSCGPEKISYDATGYKSWKYEALSTVNNIDLGKYDYSDNFLSSNWKMFHDALQKHQFEVIRDILPRYGICVS